MGPLDINNLKVSIIKTNTLNKRNQLSYKKRHEDSSNQSISYKVIVMEKVRNNYK